MDGRQIYTLGAQIRFASFGLGGVIFNLDTRESHRLNPTGASVVGLLDGHRSVNAIIYSLTSENSVNAGVVNSDVECFLNDIINRGWIDAR